MKPFSEWKHRRAIQKRETMQKKVKDSQTYQRTAIKPALSLLNFNPLQEP